VTTYTCKSCGKPVEVKGGVVKRHCGCDAGIVANIKATATGESQVATGR